MDGLGNGDTDKLYKEMRGKKITSAEFKKDSIYLTFDDGLSVIIDDQGQSCCERRYMRTDDNIKDIEGKTLVAIDIKEGPSFLTSEDRDEHEIQFLEIQTNDIAVTFASHVVHNGDYGGFSIEIRKA